MFWTKVLWFWSRPDEDIPKSIFLNYFGPKKKSEPEDVDAVTKAKKQAVEKMQDATNMVSSLFKF